MGDCDSDKVSDEVCVSEAEVVVDLYKSRWRGTLLVQENNTVHSVIRVTTPEYEV